MDTDDLNVDTVARVLAGRVLTGLVLASDSRRNSVPGPQEGCKKYPKNWEQRRFEGILCSSGDLENHRGGLPMCLQEERQSGGGVWPAEDVESEHEENLRRGARLWAGLALDDPGRDPAPWSHSRAHRNKGQMQFKSFLGALTCGHQLGPQRSELMQDGEVPELPWLLLVRACSEWRGPCEEVEESEARKKAEQATHDVAQEVGSEKA